jgi:hypothetical protein
MRRFQDADAMQEVASRALEQYWVIGFGAFLTIMLLLRNLKALIAQLHEMVDTAEEEVHKQINELSLELNKVVRQQVRDPMAAMAVVPLLARGIKAAQEKLQIRKFLPWLLRNRQILLVVCTVPASCMIVAEAAWNLKAVHIPLHSAAAGISATTSAPSSSWPLFTAALLEVPVIHGYAFPEFHRLFLSLQSKFPLDLLERQLLTIFLNLLFGSLASSPVVACIANRITGRVEKTANIVLLDKVKERIPMDKVQQAIDMRSSIGHFEEEAEKIAMIADTGQIDHTFVIEECDGLKVSCGRWFGCGSGP